MPIIEQKFYKESVVYTNGFKTYDDLVNFGNKKHYRVKHGSIKFANGQNHINGIENFWATANVQRQV